MSVMVTRRDFLASTGTIIVGCLSAPAGAFAQVANEVTPLITYEPSLPAPSDRSWYGDSFQFQTSYITRENYYDGNNVGIELDATASATVPFQITLLKGGGVVSTARLNTGGFVRAEWPGVGSGMYSFRFTSSGQRLTISCRNVAMFSW